MGRFHLVILSIILITVSFLANPSVQVCQHNQIQLPNHHAVADSSDPPTIDWFGIPENSTTGFIRMWDGIYSGQTEEVWAFEIWVNDTDGVDSVIFRFYWQGDWLNRSTTQIEGNDTRGLYASNLTYSVEWDWTIGRPSPAGSGFSFKVFANDTFGNWVETIEVTYSGGYMIIYAPVQYLLLGSPLGWAIIGATVSIVVGAAILILRRRH